MYSRATFSGIQLNETLRGVQSPSQRPYCRLSYRLFMEFDAEGHPSARKDLHCTSCIPTRLFSWLPGCAEISTDMEKLAVVISALTEVASLVAIVFTRASPHTARTGRSCYAGILFHSLRFPHFPPCPGRQRQRSSIHRWRTSQRCS